MSVPVLEALADAIYNEEGNRPPDRAYRNRNPGNLRPTDPSQPHDDGNYRIFSTFEEGYAALLHDLLCKVTGHNTHGLGPETTLWQFSMVWAPASDSNFPHSYATALAAWLTKALRVAVSVDTRFSLLFGMADEEFPKYVEPAS